MRGLPTGAGGPTLDIAKLAAQSMNYYLREVAGGPEQYYSGHGEAPGVWQGAGSRSLGLQGQVSPEEFQRMFRGQNPATGRLLGTPLREGGLPAYDLVFRPVKSVSVLWGLADPEVAQAIQEAHHAGIEYAVAYLDRSVGTRRGTDGVVHMEGRGLLAAAYEHRQSRAGDPLLHTHVVVANRIQGVDGRWLTIDGRDLFEHALAADSLYRAEYQQALTRRLGIEWTAATPAGNREIVGVPDRLIRHFSKRSEAMEVVRESRLRDGLDWNEKISNWIAHLTRPAKVPATPSALHARWIEECRQLGYDPGAIARVGRFQRQLARATQLSGAEERYLFDVLAGPDGLTYFKSTFAPRDVLVEIGRATPRLGAAEVERLAAKFLDDARVISVVTPSVRDRQEARYSTVDMLRSEKILVDTALARQGEGVAIAKPDALSLAFRKVTGLGPDQVAMVRAITQDGHGVSLVVGRAGTGKTYALHAAGLAWQHSGIEVIGCAPTGIAASQLEHGAEIPSSTADLLLWELDNRKRQLPRGSVVVVDESGMLGTRKLERLARHTRDAGAKLVLVGDDRQLQSIEAGGGFRSLRIRLGASELTTNRRQLDPLDREAVELVRSGLGADALRLYEEGGRFTIVGSQDELHLVMLRDWWEAFSRGDSAVMLTLRRADADILNDRARELLRADGRLGKKAISIGDREFSIGDYVICRKNEMKKLGVVNGTRGRVERLNTFNYTVTIRTPGRTAAEGERLVTLPLDYLKEKDPLGGPAINHAYATTTHKSQATTVDYAMIDMGGSHESEWAYVALTRARRSTHMYALEGVVPRGEDIDMPGGTFSPAVREEIAAAMSRSKAQILAFDAARLERGSRAGAAADEGNVHGESVGQLRAERDDLTALLGSAPEDRSAELVRASERRRQLDARVEEAARRTEAAQERAQALGRAGRSKRREAHEASQDATNLRWEEAERRRQAEHAVTLENRIRDQELQRQEWMRRTGEPAVERLSEVQRELAMRRRSGVRALELDTPQHIANAIGRPHIDMTEQERTAWRSAVQAIENFRGRFAVTDMTHALGAVEPVDFGMRMEYDKVREAIERVLGVERERGLGRGA